MTENDHVYYTKDHEWLKKREHNEFLLGVTDHAQEALGELVFVDLPSVGDNVARGDACVVVESVKAASDVYSPISGKIIEINDQLDGEPGLVNVDPEDRGWLCIVHAEAVELDDLMSKDQYKEFLATLD